MQAQVFQNDVVNVKIFWTRNQWGDGRHPPDCHLKIDSVLQPEYRHLKIRGMMMKSFKISFASMVMILTCSCANNTSSSQNPASPPKDAQKAVTSQSVIFPAEECYRALTWTMTYGSDDPSDVKDYACILKNLVPEGSKILSAKVLDAVNFHDVIDSILWRGPRDIVAETTENGKSLRIKFFWGYSLLDAQQNMRSHMSAASIEYSFQEQ